MKRYELFYKDEAPYGNEDFTIFKFRVSNRDDDGWEKWSLPLGNGYMGVSTFGRVRRDRLQITENSLCNPYAEANGGLQGFCDIFLDFPYGIEDVQSYRRSLCLNTGIAKTEYTYGGVSYTREHFASYPDRVFVSHIKADRAGALDMSVALNIPYVRPYLFEEGDGMGRSGELTVEQNTVTLSGEMEFYKIKYEGKLLLDTDAESVESTDAGFKLTGASYATVIMAVATNYRMEQRVFTTDDPKHKLDPYPHPHDTVESIIADAASKGYEALRRRHVEDFESLMQRADIDLGGVDEGIPTDELLEKYKGGEHSHYLEELYFRYGRYLLISSSRPGTYPANLQGTWSKYASSPWSSGYWHNINVQMNYWPAFNTNLSEMFKPYAEYFRAYLPLAENMATDYISRYLPTNHEEGQGADGWIIGTGAWLYTIFGLDAPNEGHSGPGTGAFTSKLFYDYYKFTMDEEMLREVAYPALLSMSRFLYKTLSEVDGKLLVKYSASPEQRHNGPHYHTVGCAFDQQMVYENFKDTVETAEILKIKSEFVDKLKAALPLLDPVEVGASGQIKEYREETYYSDIGDPHHRHISHLIGLYPGTVINANTPEWIEAARTTLNLRGDESTGWSTAHKINAWARTKCGNRAYDLVKMILTRCTAPNLWDLHPPFQIDGNFGATAGIAEMLLQSHEGYIYPLSALPDEWGCGSFTSLTARGGFEVSCEWREHRIVRLEILSNAGEKCKIFVGDTYINNFIRDGFIEFDTKRGGRYSFDLL